MAKEPEPGRRLKRSLAYSLALHGALLALVFLRLWYLSRNPTPELGRARGPRNGNPLLVTIEPSGKSGAQSRSKSKSNTKSPSHPSQADRAAQPKGFGLDFKLGETGKGDSSGAPSGGADGYDLANSMDLKKEGQLYPFFESLWREIDQLTRYPDDFVRERFKGQVTIQLVVDRKGVFGGKITGIRADNPYLEAYVLAVLFRALKNPLPQNLWADRSELIVVTRFDFSIFYRGDPPPVPSQQNFKNLLRFERFGYTESKVNEAIEKFFTRYFPPILIMPGVVYVDVIRAYQFIKNIGTPDPDDLRHERIHISREQWESQVERPVSNQ